MGNNPIQEQYLNWLSGRNLSPKTIKEYNLYFIRLYKLGTMNQETTDSLIHKCRNNVVRAFLKSYKEFLLRNPKELGLDKEQVESIRNIDIPRMKLKPRKIPDTISEDEVIVIGKKLRQMRKKEGMVVMLLLSYFCGLRKKELLSLTAKNFNLNEWFYAPEEFGVLKLISKGGKQSIIPVPPRIMNHVLEYCLEIKKQSKDWHKNNKPLFPIAYETWRKWLNKASMETIGKRVNPHTLRHSIATNMKRRGWDLSLIQKFLRHENISTTSIYARTDISDVITRMKQDDIAK